MKCTIENLSRLPRQHWATVTLPRSRAESLPVECTFMVDDGRRWRAVRGRDVGTKTVFRVRAFLSGGQTVHGKIVAKEHPEAGPHKWHPWVYDDLAEMVPTIGLADLSNDPSTVAWGELLEIRLVDASPAHQRFLVRQWLRNHRLHLTAFVDVLSGEPVAPFVAKITWSDRSDPAPARTFRHLLWKAGEYAAFDFATRNRIQPPVQQGRDWVALLNSEPVTLVDGASLPLSGRLLAFDSHAESAPSDPADQIDPTNRGIADLAAAADGPVIGICAEWQGDYLAARNVARFHEEAQHVPVVHEIEEWNRFKALLDTPAGWFADRPLGLSRFPGQTGDQADFGATKGTGAVVALQPRHVYAMQYSAHGDLLRGCTHYEVDGRPLQLEQHPQWVTWSRNTHWHPGVSPDRLGKDHSLPIPGGLYQSIDDEHNSMNFVAAYALLTDDAMLEDHLRHLLTTDRAGYRFRYPNNGAGVTRAQGRTAGTWAQLACVADDETAKGFVELLVQRFLQTDQTMALTGNGLMRAPCVNGPDPRKPVFDLQGQLTSSVCMWELGLFLVGFAQVLRSGKHAGDLTVANRIMLACSETMARFGFFLQDGTYYTVDDVMWNDGNEPPGGLRYPSPHVLSAPGAGATGSWTFAGALVARDYLPRMSREWDSLNRYIEAITGGKEAGDVKAAEWWAITDAIDRPAQVPVT